MTRIEELKKTNLVLTTRMARVKEEQDQEVSKVSSELKQAKIAHDNLKLESEIVSKKYAEAENYLRQEVLKTSKLKEEVANLKEKVSSLETKLKTASSGQNEGHQSSVLRERHLHNPIKSSATNSKNNSQVDLIGNLKKSAREEYELDYIQKEQAKKVALLEKSIEISEGDKKKLEQKLASIDATISRKDAELTELRKSIEEKADLNLQLQEDNKKLNMNVKVLKEKRDLGLKEIQKLRDKMEQMKNQHALSDSLNTSFSMSAMNDSVNLSQRDKSQVSELLSMYHRVT